MRIALPILAAMMLVGCQAKPEPQVETSRQPAFLPASAALAFTPPVAMDEDYLDLSRDGRGGYAVGGFETTIIEETYVRQDDRMRQSQWGGWSQFERRSVSTSVTIRRR